MKKFLLLLMAAVIGTSVFAEETASASERPKTPHSERRHKRPPRRSFQKGHGMWTAFAHLSAEERQNMLKLQREDPEKFRTEMNKLAEKFFNAEKERRQELAKLIMEYKNATDDKVKTEIHEKIKVRMTVAELFAVLIRNGGFARVGSAYIINLRNIKNVSTSEVHLYNDISIPIPRGKHAELKKAFWDFQCEGEED